MPVRSHLGVARRYNEGRGEKSGSGEKSAGAPMQKARSYEDPSAQQQQQAGSPGVVHRPCGGHNFQPAGPSLDSSLTGMAMPMGSAATSATSALTYQQQQAVYQRQLFDQEMQAA